METTLQTLTLRLISLSRGRFRNTWIHRLPLTSAIYRSVFQQAFKGDVRRIRFRDIDLIVDTRDVTIVPTLLTGEYESFELDLLERILSKGDVFVDVGSNIGVYSLIASRVVGSNGTVIGFEPVEANYVHFRENIVLNNCEARVAAHHNAVGAVTGEKIRIYLDEDSIGTHSAVQVSDRYEEVETVSLDDLVERDALHVQAMKVDVEGYENYVLQGASHLIASHRPTLFIEYDEAMLQASNCKTDNIIGLFDLYEHRYLVDERRAQLVDIDAGQLGGLRNSNLLFSTTPIG